MIGLKEYAYATWFTRRNHERAAVKSIGLGIDESIF